MKESDDQRFEPRGSPPFVIFVCLSFMHLCGDAVISADAAGTAASQSKQAATYGKKLAMMPFYFCVAPWQWGFAKRRLSFRHK